MGKQLTLSGIAAIALTAGTVTAVPAQAATPTTTVDRCHAHLVAHTKHWTCVTPGSYCPAAAHGRYGYAYKTGKRYKCVRYTDGRWHWKRA